MYLSVVSTAEQTRGKTLGRGIYVKRMLSIFILSIIAYAAGADGTIVDDWSSVQPPQAPTLVSVKVDPATTALLLLDFQDRIIGGRPRSLATVPRVKKLLDFARSSGLVVAYSLGGSSDAASIVADLKPLSTEHVVHASVDKFYGTDLDAYLKSKGITTLIITGLGRGRGPGNKHRRLPARLQSHCSRGRHRLARALCRAVRCMAPAQRAGGQRQRAAHANRPDWALSEEDALIL